MRLRASGGRAGDGLGSSLVRWNEVRAASHLDTGSATLRSSRPGLPPAAGFSARPSLHPLCTGSSTALCSLCAFHEPDQVHGPISCAIAKGGSLCALTWIAIHVRAHREHIGSTETAKSLCIATGSFNAPKTANSEPSGHTWCDCRELHDRQPVNAVSCLPGWRLGGG